jgi:RHS repeat-associated protein
VLVLFCALLAPSSSSALASALTLSASDLETRVGGLDGIGASFELQRREPTGEDASGKAAFTDGKRGGRNLPYNRFRYFDPTSGRYISPDPLGLVGGLNLFQYAPNTTGWVDSFGLAKKPCGEAVQAAWDAIAKNKYAALAGLQKSQKRHQLLAKRTCAAGQWRSEETGLPRW